MHMDCWVLWTLSSVSCFQTVLEHCGMGSGKHLTLTLSHFLCELRAAMVSFDRYGIWSVRRLMTGLSILEPTLPWLFHCHNLKFDYFFKSLTWLNFWKYVMEGFLSLVCKYDSTCISMMITVQCVQMWRPCVHMIIFHAKRLETSPSVWWNIINLSSQKRGLKYCLHLFFG